MKVLVDSWAWLPKNALSDEKLRELKRLLTIKPLKVGDYPGDPPKPLHLFTEKADSFGIPRSYFFENKQPHHEVITNYSYGSKVGWPGPIEFAGILKPDQTNAVNTIVAELTGGAPGGILRAACGWGKTTATLALIAKLGVPTIVLLHKGFLLRQWQERMEVFLPNAKVGLVQQDSCEYKGYHIALAMNDSLTSRTYPDDFYDHFGLVVSDEVHRIGAPTWSLITPRFRAAWRLGLSATPRRKDKADNVFHFHIGPLLYNGKVEGLKPKIKRVYSKFRFPTSPSFNPTLVKKTLAVKFLVKNEARNQLIVEQIQNAALAGRKILVLSERLDTHLRVLERMFRDSWGTINGPCPSTSFYIGGMKDSAYEEAEKATIIFATSQLVTEGLDIPPIDTLVLTTPMSDVEQAVGRIQRPYPGKKDPIVVDIRDDYITLCKRLGESRWKFYLRKNWVLPEQQ